jgi:hypothetical protein
MLSAFHAPLIKNVRALLGEKCSRRLQLLKHFTQPKGYSYRKDDGDFAFMAESSS